MSPDPNNFGYRITAAARVFNDYGSFIRIVIRSQVQDADHAEDLFQNFFLALVSNPLPRGLRNIEGYLYRAITNDVVDATRRTAKYRANLHKYSEPIERLVAQKTPEETVLEVEEVNRVLELIEKRLPPAQAEAVSLLYRSSYNVKEVAETMGVADATARAHISDALDTLRKLLGNMEAGVIE